MNYHAWALFSAIAYGFAPPLIRYATSGTDAIPSDIAAAISNGIFVLMAFAVAIIGPTDIGDALTNPKMVPIAISGVIIGVSVLAYYRAIALGPVSVVTPIFAMYIVVTGLLGVAVLDEPLTAQKVLGVGFAVIAIYLLTNG